MILEKEKKNNGRFRTNYLNTETIKTTLPKHW